MVEQAAVPNLDGLVELGNRDGVDIRPTLLRVTTDLYVAKATHTAEEERHYVELALRLIDLVDAPTRAIVAQRLASYPAAPPAVLQRLARETGSMPAVSPATVDAPRTERAMESNELSELFFSSNANERRLILLNLEYAPVPPAEPLGGKPAADSIRRLELHALSHDRISFADEIQRSLAISRAQARRLTNDDSGEPLVVAAIALGMPAGVLQRILLCLNPAISQSVQRVYELVTLYEDIEPQAALRMLSIWRATQHAEPPAAAQRPAAHQSYYWHVEDDARSAPAERRPAAVPAVSDAPSAARPHIRWDEHAKRKA